MDIELSCDFRQYFIVHFREHLFADNVVSRKDVNWYWETQCQQIQKNGQKIWWILEKFCVQPFFLRSIYPCSIKQKFVKIFIYSYLYLKFFWNASGAERLFSSFLILTSKVSVYSFGSDKCRFSCFLGYSDIKRKSSEFRANENHELAVYDVTFDVENGSSWVSSILLLLTLISLHNTTYQSCIQSFEKHIQ